MKDNMGMDMMYICLKLVKLSELKNLKCFPTVRTASHEVKLMFILCFGSNRNAFYLYMVTHVACSSTPCNVHVWLYKGCGYR